MQKHICKGQPNTNCDYAVIAQLIAANESKKLIEIVNM